MERASDVASMRPSFEWDDVGSWQAISRLDGTDAEGNTTSGGRHLGLQTSGTILRRRGQPFDRHARRVRSDRRANRRRDVVANKHDEESIRQLVK